MWWPVALAATLVIASSLACQVEIATTAAQSEPPVSSGSGAPAGTPVLAAAPAVASAPATLTISPPLASGLTPSASQPISSTVTPTPEAAAVIPAQAPPDRIVASAIKLEAPVMPMGWTPRPVKDGSVTSVWVIPDHAAGWHQNSALPGHGGNVVLSGHHNTGSEVFRYLVDLKPGDEVTLNAGGRAYRYVVTDRFILPERGISEEQRRQNAQWISPTTTERLTLVTCWPYTSNTHRVIVLAKPAN